MRQSITRGRILFSVFAAVVNWRLGWEGRRARVLVGEEDATGEGSDPRWRVAGGRRGHVGGGVGVRGRLGPGIFIPVDLRMRGRENGRSSLSGLQAWKLLPPGRLWKGRREGSYALLYQVTIYLFIFYRAWPVEGPAEILCFCIVFSILK
jgi:hypothetical protein